MTIFKPFFSLAGCCLHRSPSPAVCVCVRRIERGGVSSCERLKVSDTGRVLQRAHTPRLLSGEGGRTEAVDGEGSRRRKKKEHEIIRPSDVRLVPRAPRVSGVSPRVINDERNLL